jgi:hypothetical protein
MAALSTRLPFNVAGIANLSVTSMLIELRSLDVFIWLLALVMTVAVTVPMVSGVPETLQVTAPLAGKELPSTQTFCVGLLQEVTLTPLGKPDMPQLTEVAVTALLFVQVKLPV